jgi:hypothetical protein
MTNIEFKGFSPVKLPKQWRDWCTAAKLRPSGWLDKRTYGKLRWGYLRGHGRFWRVGWDGTFQCGDKYEDFDRWALCKVSQAPMPKTRDEFVATVRALVTAHDYPRGVISEAAPVTLESWRNIPLTANPKSPGSIVFSGPSLTSGVVYSRATNYRR